MGERPTGETPLVILQCFWVSPMGHSLAAIQPLLLARENLGKSAWVLLSWQSRKENSDSISWDSYSPATVILISNLIVIVVVVAVVISDTNSCIKVSLLQMLQELGDAHAHRDPIFIKHACRMILTLLIGSVLLAQRCCTIYDVPIKVHPSAVS